MADATVNKIDEAKAEVLAEKAYAAATAAPVKDAPVAKKVAAPKKPVAKKIAKPAPAK